MYRRHKTCFLPFSEFCESFEDRWQTAFNSSKSNLDLSPAWAKALVASRSLDDAYVLYALDSESFDILFPFAIERSRLGSLNIMPLSSYFCLRADIFGNTSDTEKIFRIIASFNLWFPRWSSITINNCLTDSSLMNAVRDRQRELSLRVRTTPAERPPFLLFDKDWENFLAGKSQNFRYNLKRKAAKLAKQGRTKFEFVQGTNRLEDAFNDIHSIENSSWKFIAGTSLSPVEDSFYRHLLEGVDDNEKCFLISFLYVDEIPIAYDLTLISTSTAYCLKTSFSENYAKCSPGTVLRAKLLERIFDYGLTEYDFLGADENYKMGWASGVRELCHISIYNDKLLAMKLTNIIRGVLYKRRGIESSA